MVMRSTVLEKLLTRSLHIEMERLSWLLPIAFRISRLCVTAFFPFQCLGENITEYLCLLWVNARFIAVSIRK